MSRPMNTLTLPIGTGESKTPVEYTFVQLDNTLTVSGKAADAKKVGDELSDVKADLSQKASADGTYEGMTVGNAEQLNSSQYAEDKTPYLFRASGGGVDVGTREEDTVVGGSVAWNQTLNSNAETKTNYGCTLTYDETAHKYMLTGTASASGYITFSNNKFDHVIDHKTLFLFSNAINHCDVSLGSGDFSPYFIRESSILIAKTTKSGHALQLRVYDGYTYNGEFSLGVFDLTAMFGATIADYLYNLEQATAGAGVALFRKLFPKPYYPYDAGTLKHVEGLVSHDMVGFNQWDGEYTENAWLDDTGSVVNNVQGYNVTDYIPILPNTTYYKSTSGSNRSYYYDADKRMLLQLGANPAQTITTPSGACYARFTVTSANLDGFILNLSDPAKNGIYEPYAKHSYPLDSTLTLRGIPKLDANNNIYFDGDTYEADGTVTRRYGVVTFDGTETGWARYGYGGFGIALSNLKMSASDSTIANIKSDRFIAESYASMSGNAQDMAVAAHYTTNSIIFYIAAITTVEDWLTYLTSNPTTVVYELTTPTTEEADPYTTPQIVDEYGTEEYVIDESVTVPVPVGHITRYPANLRKKIEGLPWDFSALIAPTEATYTATRAYTTGALFIVDNTLYKATTSIASGGTITPGTNCTATTLAEVISAL